MTKARQEPDDERSDHRGADAADEQERPPAERTPAVPEHFGTALPVVRLRHDGEDVAQHLVIAAEPRARERHADENQQQNRVFLK